MAIKERKQITGTEAQIKGYAGHNGVLAYATDTKHLHVLSGTAGTTTKLANMSDIPAPVDISGKADKTYVDTELAKKQAKGDYATTKALTDGLAGKANKAHTHAIADVTNLQTTLNTINDKIPKTGNRGALAGYSTSAVGTTVDASAKDSQYATSGAVTVKNGATGQAWTKVVKMSAGTVTLGSNWAWVDGEAPELSFPCLLICHWNNDKGIAGVVKGAS
nr:MAG TPA: tail repeat-like protein [Caudoviricetes sp.]